jgi:DNA topoisomerase VI subunit B
MTKITSSSTAEYFSKNLQQVGFSSPLKAVLTTVKEAVDNALDACEQEGILPDIEIEIKKIGTGSSKNTDLIKITVEDNGPGIDPEDLAKVRKRPMFPWTTGHRNFCGDHMGTIDQRQGRFRHDQNRSHAQGCEGANRR